MSINSVNIYILGGFISPQGSAAYLKETVQSENEVTVIMNVDYTTRTETLSASIKNDHEELCLLNGPTHVVTSVTYGMQTNILFKKDAATNESKEALSKNLIHAVKSIPSYKVKVHSGIGTDGKIKKTVENVYVKLFGDFLSSVEPTTFEESVIAYRNLSSHLGEATGYPNAVKLNMRLTPLKRFCRAHDNMLVGISNNIVHSVLIMLDEIEKTNLKAKTLLMADSVNRFSPLKMVINTFINKLNKFQLKLKDDLQILLPNIRMGSGSEKGLIELLTNYRKSPFNYAFCNNFLKTRQHEIEMIDHIIKPERFQGTDVQILNYEHTNIFFNKPLIVMIKFNILPNLTIVNDFLEGKHMDESKSWFFNPEVVGAMGKEFKSYMDFASANKDSKKRGYLVAMYNSKKPLVNVYVQEEGKVLSSNFSFPQLPPKMTKCSNTYNSIQFSIKRPDDKWIKGVLVTYRKPLREERDKQQEFTFTHENTTNILITGLSPNQMYRFSMQYVTIMGNSMPSPKSSPISTRPCSIPTNLRINNLTSTSFNILWDRPFHMGTGAYIDYDVTVENGK